MKVAVIGSRSLKIPNLQNYVPKETTLIISGGCEGVDACARDFALEHNIRLLEFLPEGEADDHTLLLKRILAIIESAELVLAFWDGKSRGTAIAMQQCILKNIPYRSYMRPDSEQSDHSFLQIWINPLKILASIDESRFKC